MAGFGRKKRFLTCFYCGRRTSTQYDGGIRRFDCPNCDATNYLDENGDITDPPVATTSIEPKATQYATSRPNPSRAKDNADSIFCDTCLKNQHLFTASLAQYLPEDPDHPEYEELERKYYKFRKGLERRYPQVCADCEPKVLGRITQAGYTAKTDHLRRMIDRSRENRTKASLSAVNVVSSAGRWLWLAGLWLQLLWHLSLCLELVEDPANLQSSPLPSVLESHKFILSLLHLLPSPEDLLRYCLYASILSFAWNPQLSQTLRGFSKHIKGLSTWYIYQLMITVTRIAFSKAAALLMRQQISAMAQITAHCVMAMFTIYIYVVAGRSVKIDTTPLFGTSPKRPSSPPPPPRSKSLHTSAREERSMSDLLDEILEAPSKPADSIGDMAHAKGAMNGYSTLNVIQNAPGNPQAASDFHLGSLNISGQSFSSGRSDPVQYSEEMDWTPTQSRHRAFNTSGSSQSPLKSFGDAPVESDRAQFWYKIPPAPTSMAQRILNPPNQPRLHSPVNKQDLNFRGTSGMFKPSAKTDNTGVESVEFAQPSLFLPAATDDPRDPLSDMFTQSFSLSQSQADGAHLKRGKRSTPKNTAVSRHISFCVAELAILSVCLLGWLYIGAAGHQISTRAALLIFGLCIAISMDATKDSFYALRATKSSIWIPALGVIFGAAELLLTSLVVFQLWSTDSTAGHMNMGGWLIGATIVHQLWNLMFH